MITHRRAASRTLLVLGTAAALSGCGIVGISCTDELRPSVVVAVRDAVTRAPAARGVTGYSEHESGVLTEFYATDDLYLNGDWSRELPGNHTVHTRKPGFLTDIVHVDVDRDVCHVEPGTVQVQLAPDALAWPEHPVSFIEGPEIDAWPPASAGVQVYGDTLEIKGFAPSDCTELRIVAFRSGDRLHVQVEPSDIPPDPCVSPSVRQFEARFTLPPERTYLLVTNGFLLPGELFNGQVRPSEAGVAPRPQLSRSRRQTSTWSRSRLSRRIVSR